MYYLFVPYHTAPDFDRIKGKVYSERTPYQTLLICFGEEILQKYVIAKYCRFIDGIELVTFHSDYALTLSSEELFKKYERGQTSNLTTIVGYMLERGSR